MSEYEDHIDWLESQKESRVIFSETGKVTVEAKDHNGNSNGFMGDSFTEAIVNLRSWFASLEAKADDV